MRKFIPVAGDPDQFMHKLLAWSEGCETVCLLNSNSDAFSVHDPYSKFNWCAGIDAVDQIASTFPAFESLKNFHVEKEDWIFGFLTYDLKNEIEDLESNNEDHLAFPSIHFFQPRYLFTCDGKQLQAGFLPKIDSEESVLKLAGEIISGPVSSRDDFPGSAITPREEKAAYISSIEKIKQHIQRGDIYEMNYCVEFFSEDALISPSVTYRHLNEISPMPFSCFYKRMDQYLLCASPERFIAKRGNKIISQPIKGTARRGSSSGEDAALKAELFSNEKERSENVMIVDLVRNDLSVTAAKGSVHVEELFGIYSFRQLHQMISTVVSEVREGVHWTEVIKHAFPMGSMTGAPKIRAMQLIEEFESSKRGLYSGAAGYVTPEGDFDFNVVIRSILYHETKKYLSFMVGSAITINSDAEKEYAECMLKAKAMLQVLEEGKLNKVH